jgi:hypothetical protein
MINPENVYSLADLQAQARLLGQAYPCDCRPRQVRKTFSIELLPDSGARLLADYRCVVCNWTVQRSVRL